MSKTYFDECPKDVLNTMQALSNQLIVKCKFNIAYEQPNEHVHSDSEYECCNGNKLFHVCTFNFELIASNATILDIDLVISNFKNILYYDDAKDSMQYNFRRIDNNSYITFDHFNAAYLTINKINIPIGNETYNYLVETMSKYNNNCEHNHI